MSSQLRQALQILRDRTSNDSELGTAFEKLVRVFLENDSTQTQEYEKVWLYKDWAKERPTYPQTDVGIDLVAQLRDGSGFCAVQCKFYQAEHTISKADLDSFISASATPDFSRLLLVDTSTQDIGKNAQNVFDNLTTQYIRIPLSELEQSRIDWLTWVREDRVRLYSKKELKEHQSQALEAIREGLKQTDRGKLIMACGTGKTFTSLRIAEDLAGKGKLVLYMVPSLALMSQSLRDWKNDAKDDFTAFSACSDIKVGKRNNQDDEIVVGIHDLAFPATTDPAKLAEQVKRAGPERMTVVFSTYHSIDVISQAQADHGLREFDLIICDEAHRTTGATLVGDDESNFVKIHSNANVKGSKRLYMTATPRIFGEKAKSKADDGNVALASMDDENIFGKVLFHRGFGWAVENNLLTDYKVVVLAVDEGIVSEHVQNRLAEGAELKLDDATKIIGCYKALAKVGFKDGKGDQETINHLPMKRALAFCQNIALSKMFAAEFTKVVDEYSGNEDVLEDRKTDLVVQVEHVDGTYNAEQRNERLGWLKDETEKNVCRVLTNARCLSEGVDVPALDAIMFLHPRKSQIDVVQSVGRVMRKHEGKDLGYVILPITVAPGVTPEKALNDNEKYKVVWQILNALRAHDERFDSTLNRIGLGEDVSDRLEIVGVGAREELDATTVVVEDIKDKKKRNQDDEDDEAVLGDEKKDEEKAKEDEPELPFVMSDLSQAIKAKIVEKCGTRDYWENWASDIAKIAQKHIVRIQKIVFNEGTTEKAAFKAFLEEIRDDLNPEVTETEAVEMLAQHLITKPVFDTLFIGNKFTAENSVSRAMETVLDQLHHHSLDKEADSLEKFYASVKRRAADITTSAGRQTLVLELYHRFFRNAFPTLTQRLGIVYTPVEVVDFIVHSVNDVLRDEFGKGLGNKNVHILDPFTGTGTFITRLLQSRLIAPEELPYKFKNEIHANEIVLLAYYIAAINIEAVYQDLARENQYQPFNGIVLTDTFQLYEQDRDMVANLLPDNSNRRTAQKKRAITVIFGNPPYSSGQKSENDDAENTSYQNLDHRIGETYVKSSTNKMGKSKAYDSYIRAYRWASDRIGNQGVIGFVTNAGWVEANATDGLRKCLKEEFSKIYVFHLRGNARTAGEQRRKEKGNVFGEGSRAPIAIVILVKDTSKSEHGQILFHDIGDYLEREQKLAVVKHFKSIKGISAENKWLTLVPDEHNDWVNQGEEQFQSFISIGDKKGTEKSKVFGTYSIGVKSNRDHWVYSFSKSRLKSNMTATISFYNAEAKRLNGCSFEEAKKKINRDKKLFSWTDDVLAELVKGTEYQFDEEKIVVASFRPFTKMCWYSDRKLNWSLHQMGRLFPNPDARNLVIGTTSPGASIGFSTLMTDHVTNNHFMNTGQCFPLNIFDVQESADGLFAGLPTSDKYFSTDGIENDGLAHFVARYPRAQISKLDLFHYVYGLFHSPEYLERFQNNLSKELPRIPAVKRYEDFIAFVDAGRNLGEIHVNYEKAPPYPITYKQGDLRLANIPDPKSFYRVENMKYGGKRPNQDKTTVVYNHNITMTNIPLAAYEYVVNGKPAIEWVMDRQCVSTDKASGIVNDANDYANETMNNPAYPLELFQRVITVSLETMKIVKSLPKLDID